MAQVVTRPMLIATRTSLLAENSSGLICSPLPQILLPEKPMTPARSKRIWTAMAVLGVAALVLGVLHRSRRRDNRGRHRANQYRPRVSTNLHRLSIQTVDLIPVYGCGCGSGAGLSSRMSSKNTVPEPPVAPASPVDPRPTAILSTLVRSMP